MIELVDHFKYKKKWIMLKCPCILQVCSCCEEFYPQWILDLHGGHCIECERHNSSGIIDCTIKLKRLRALQGVCLACGNRLVPVGRSRTNGKDHDDWNDREYHKKCWKGLEL